MILKSSLAGWVIAMTAIGCCGRDSVTGQSALQTHAPLDIALLIHTALKAGNSNVLRPIVLSEADIRSIASDPEEKNKPVRSPDGISEHFVKQIDKALQSACAKYRFEHSHVTAFKTGNRLIEKTYGEMVRIEPAECIDYMLMEITLATNGARVKVSVGGIMRIGNQWKLDGWFSVADAD